MIDTLAFGFFGEGPSDYDFLQPLMRRTLQLLLPMTEILEPISLEHLSKQSGVIARVAEETYGYALVIFHLDADAPDTRKAYYERFEPDYTTLKSGSGKFNLDIVPLIPVRAMEAWLLVDFEAFRKVVGTKLKGKELGFPDRPEQVEGIPDPKNVFEMAIKQARPQRRPIAVNEVLQPMADRLDLARLERVPAYQEFLERLETKLRELKYL